MVILILLLNIYVTGVTACGEEFGIGKGYPNLFSRCRQMLTADKCEFCHQRQVLSPIFELQS